MNPLTVKLFWITCGLIVAVFGGIDIHNQESGIQAATYAVSKASPAPAVPPPTLLVTWSGTPASVSAPVPVSAPAPVPVSVPVPVSAPITTPVLDAPPVIPPTRDPYRITDSIIDTVIALESRGDPNAVGRKGERGLMQLLPETWGETCRRTFGRHVSFDRAFEVELNQRVGTAYLEYLAETLTESKAEWQSPFLELLFASYNAGPHAVQRAEYHMERLPRSVQDYAERCSNLVRQPSVVPVLVNR